MRIAFLLLSIFALGCQNAAPDTLDHEMLTPASTSTQPSVSASVPSADSVAATTTTGNANDSLARAVAQMMCTCTAIRQSTEINYQLKGIDTNSPQYAELHQAMMALIPAIEACTKPLDAAFAALSIPDQLKTTELSDKYTLQLCPDLAAKFNKQQ